MTTSIPAPSKTEIQEFSIKVTRAARDLSVTYFDALVMICEQNAIDPEVAAKLLDPVLKDRIQRDAESLNFLKTKKHRLPVG